MDEIEAELRQQPEELRARFQPEVFHYFAPGMYVREARLRAGTCMTTKINKFENLSIVSKGRLVFHLPDGSAQVVEAGSHIVTPAGTRRVVLVIEDAVWTCMHPTDLSDLEQIERHFIAQDMDEFLSWAGVAER